MSKDKLKGIYYYRDKKNGNIVYIGKDSNIVKNTRHHAHMCKSYYDNQPFNRVLQNNPNRYEYGIFCKGHYSDVDLIELEKYYKWVYTPLFDFEFSSNGGLTESHKKKISESRKGYKHKESSKQLMSEHHYDCSDDKNPRFLKHLPTNRELYVEWRRGTSQKDLSMKYNCGLATIQRRIKKYQNEIKDKPQLRTSGKRKDGKLMYCIYWNGEYVKYSVYKDKLVEWFENEYGVEVILF